MSNDPSPPDSSDDAQDQPYPTLPPEADTRQLPSLADAMEQLAHYFSETGPLARSLPRFRARPSQLALAQSVATSIIERQVLYAEAGTGTGKTYAYLVPALLWGGRVIISTATKNLQDQLFQHDLPTLQKVLSLPLSLALLKGRSNYVCLFHLERNSASGMFTSAEEVKQFQAIKRFANVSASGDIATCAEVPVRAPVWQLATASRDNCLGAECEDYERCFLMAARKRAMNADVVVVNHHLFFADAAIKEDGMGELLPTANTVIFDEAHQVPEIASGYFGSHVSYLQLADFARDLLRDGRSEQPDAADWLQQSQALEQALREWRLFSADWSQRTDKKAIPQLAAFKDSTDALAARLESIAATLQPFSGALTKLSERGQEMAAALRRWFDDLREIIYWVEKNNANVTLNQTPLTIHRQMQALWEGFDGAWVFASATLALNHDFSYFADKLGLSETVQKAWQSPFDYGNNAMLYVPTITAPVHSPQFLSALVEVLTPVLEVLQGRTFVLCTSLKAVAQLAEELRRLSEDRGWNIPILEQGRSGAAQTLARFRKNPNSVLVASYSFWEGVDIPGDDLQCVVIDKLPFLVPNDPVLAAQLQYLESQGKNGFRDYQVPEAAISLKQGAGRLIRGESDRGILLIADPRLAEKDYGKKMWRSLPPFRRTRKPEEALDFVRSLKDKEGAGE